MRLPKWKYEVSIPVNDPPTNYYTWKFETLEKAEEYQSRFPRAILKEIL